jgi:hypothetical protein
MISGGVKDSLPGQKGHLAGSEEAGGCLLRSVGFWDLQWEKTTQVSVT